MRQILIQACNTCPYIEGNPHTGYYCKAQGGKRLLYFNPDENDCKLEITNIEFTSLNIINSENGKRNTHKKL